MTAYYNDVNPYVCEWLTNLTNANQIAPGIVQCQDIKNIQKEELSQYKQVHFFAGIGGWSYALRMAGWPDSEQVWTGSCPCQPFSQQTFSHGGGSGTNDPRHLWPEFFRLIRECKPSVIFGEQVASKPGIAWLGDVFTDLGSEGYATGAAVLGAHSAGAPHGRQRLFWLGYSSSFRTIKTIPKETTQEIYSINRTNSDDSLPGMDTTSALDKGSERDKRGSIKNRIDRARYGYHWREREYIPSACGRQRILFPGAIPLVNGFPSRMEQIRAYGNAIVPQVAAEFIVAFLEVMREENNGKP